MLDDMPVGNPFASFAAAAAAAAAGAAQPKQEQATPAAVPVVSPAPAPAPALVSGPSAAWHNVPVPDDEKHLPFALRKQWRRAAFDKIHGEVRCKHRVCHLLTWGGRERTTVHVSR